MIWYVDMEYYHFDNKCYAKEIAIVNDDASKCFHYLIKNPRHIPERPTTPSCNYQYKRHKLAWNFGEYNFSAAILDIKEHIKTDKVFAKGDEKTKFLQKWLPQLEDAVWITTPFKNLNSCFSEWCNIKHGIHCARRKAHELMKADKIHRNNLCELITVLTILPTATV